MFLSLFKRFFLLCLSVAVASTHAQSTADPAYANMQRAVGGIIQQQAQAKGYSLTDPRTYGTMYQVGKYSASAVSGAGAAAGAAVLVAGAPAWATLLAVAVVGSGISYAVNLGIDAAVTWAFGPTLTAPIAVTAPVLNPGTSFAKQITLGSDPVTLSLPTGKLFMDQVYGTAYMGICISRDSMTHITCTQAIGPSMNSYAPTATTQVVPNCSIGTTGGAWGGAVLNPYGYPIQKILTPSQGFGGYTHMGHTCGGTVIDSGSLIHGYPIPEHAKNCPVGFAVVYDVHQNKYSDCMAFATSVTGPGQPETTSKTLSDAVAALTSTQKAVKVDYQTMATLVNHVWQQAAAQPGYDGLPYTVTQPVTATDVQAWAQANPSAYPTVGALTSPVGNAQTDFAPSTSTAPTTTTIPAVNPVAPTATNPSSQTSQVNLGPDPNIGPPSLENTPTAQMILAPLIALFPDLKSYSVPGHSGTCPKPTFEVFGKSITMDQHCTIFEGQRSTLYAAGLLAFTLLALFIVLSA